MNIKAYQHVYQTLKRRNTGAKYPIGSFLPTESELERLFSVSRTTVRHAISLLVDDGYVSVKQGRGTEIISGEPSDRYYKFPQHHRRSGSVFFREQTTCCTFSLH